MLQAISNYEGNRLLNTATDDLVAYFVSLATVDPIVLREDQIHADEHEIKVDVSDRWDYATWGRPSYVPGVTLSLYVPFEGEADLFNHRPSSFTSSPPNGLIRGQDIVLSYEAPQGRTEGAKNFFDRELAQIRHYAGWIKDQVTNHNNGLSQTARQAVEERKQRLLQNRNTVASLGYPLRRRPDAPATYTLPTVRKTAFLSPPPASTAPFVPEPVLADVIYEQILSILGNMVRVMEHSAGAFAHMNEEDLRTHFLVQLNGQFEGRASAETFRGSGATDILLEDRDRSVFIAECKFWKGPSSLSGALEQLLDYATWRDAKAAVLIFSRNKDFSQVLEAVPKTLDEFPAKAGSIDRLSESVFRLKIRQRDNPARLLTVTTRVYNVPVDREVSTRLTGSRKTKQQQSKM